MKLSIALRYLITPIVVYISVAVFINVFSMAFPWAVGWFLEYRGDSDFWSLFGKWGIYIVVSISGIFLASMYGHLAELLTEKISKISPNNKFTLYTYMIISIIYFILCIYSFWINTEASPFGIMRMILDIVLIAIILFFINMGAADI